MSTLDFTDLDQLRDNSVGRSHGGIGLLEPLPRDLLGHVGRTSTSVEDTLDIEKNVSHLASLFSYETMSNYH